MLIRLYNHYELIFVLWMCTWLLLFANGHSSLPMVTYILQWYFEWCVSAWVCWSLHMEHQSTSCFGDSGSLAHIGVRPMFVPSNHSPLWGLGSFGIPSHPCSFSGVWLSLIPFLIVWPCVAVLNSLLLLLSSFLLALSLAAVCQYIVCSILREFSFCDRSLSHRCIGKVFSTPTRMDLKLFFNLLMAFSAAFFHFIFGGTLCYSMPFFLIACRHSLDASSSSMCFLIFCHNCGIIVFIFHMLCTFFLKSCFCWLDEYEIVVCFTLYHYTLIKLHTCRQWPWPPWNWLIYQYSKEWQINGASLLFHHFGDQFSGDHQLWHACSMPSYLVCLLKFLYHLLFLAYVWFAQTYPSSPIGYYNLTC